MRELFGRGLAALVLFSLVAGLYAASSAGGLAGAPALAPGRLARLEWVDSIGPVEYQSAERDGVEGDAQGNHKAAIDDAFASRLRVVAPPRDRRGRWGDRSPDKVGSAPIYATPARWRAPPVRAPGANENSKRWGIR